MDYERFQNLTFNDFKTLAQDNTLTNHEKIGFPNSYREGQEEAIITDISHKLQQFNQHDKTILDIGIGCGVLALAIISHCRNHHHNLILIDSQEVLDLLPNEPFITKVAGYYPNEFDMFVKEHTRKIDIVLTYSVLHYIFVEANIFSFVDISLSLLAPNGEMLIGDIPNVSKRKRFFSSENGIEYHKSFTNTIEAPEIHFNSIEKGKMDDSVIMSLLLRCRNAGFDAYILPHSK